MREPQGSLNDRRIFGSVTVKDPARVVKLCLVLDNHKIPFAWRLWPEVEEFNMEQLAHLNFQATDLFFSELIPFEGKSMSSLYRYYTPIDNRTHTHARRAKMP